MNKTMLILAALALGACSSPKDPSYEHPASANRNASAPVQSGAGAPVVSQSNPPATVVVPAPALRAGLGRVDAVMASSAAAAGGTASSSYTLHVRMDDGTLQYVTQTSPEFRVGDRVEVTRDGRVIRR